MSKTIKVYLATGYTSYAYFLESFAIVNTIAEADLVIFEGGEDINPELYNEPVGRYTSFNDHRDNIEVQVYLEAQALGKPCWGTCRGLQLLTALAGGKLVQDMDHRSSHELTFYDGFKMITNTLHHQMAYPYNLVEGKDYYLLAAAYGLSKVFHDGNNQQMTMPIVDGKTQEPEMLYYPKINAVGIQGHPEMMYEGSTMVTVCRAFASLLMQGVLQDVMQLGLGVEQIVERAEDFTFTEEEQLVLTNLKDVEYASRA